MAVPCHPFAPLGLCTCCSFCWDSPNCPPPHLASTHASFKKRAELLLPVDVFSLCAPRTPVLHCLLENLWGWRGMNGILKNASFFPVGRDRALSCPHLRSVLGFASGPVGPCGRRMFSGFAEAVTGVGSQVRSLPSHLHSVSLLVQKGSTFSTHEPRLAYGELVAAESLTLPSVLRTVYLRCEDLPHSSTRQTVTECPLYARLPPGHWLPPRNKTSALPEFIGTSHTLNSRARSILIFTFKMRCKNKV